MLAQNDPVTLPPIVEGPYGRAWLVDLDAACRKVWQTRDDFAQLDGWIIEAPWAHPIWHSYLLALMHLRPMADRRKTLIYQIGVTHEVHLCALNPEHPRQPVMEGQEPWRWLEPINFAAQITEPDDAAARARVRRAVEEICGGVLNPDTDYLHQWVQRFGGNMVKREPVGTA